MSTFCEICPMSGTVFEEIEGLYGLDLTKVNFPDGAEPTDEVGVFLDSEGGCSSPIYIPEEDSRPRIFEAIDRCDEPIMRRYGCGDEIPVFCKAIGLLAITDPQTKDIINQYIAENWEEIMPNS